MAATMDQILETLQEFRKEVYQKFDQIDQRFDKIEVRLDKVEGRLDQAERNMEIMKKYYFQDRTMMMQLIHEVKDQQKEDHKMIMEDHKMILDIWASRDKVTINFNRKLYIATASISVVVSTVISTGISLAVQGM